MNETKQTISISYPQWAAQNGYHTDYTVDHGILSPNGTISKRAKSTYCAAHQEKLNSYDVGTRKYQSLVDCGDIIDPTGKYTLTPREKTEYYIAAQSRILQIINHNRTLSIVGIGKNGKIKPIYQRSIDANNVEIETLQSRLNQLRK